jgi:glycosyltransferase 2 family protein
MPKKYFNLLLFGALGFGLLYYIYQSQAKSYLASCMANGQTADQCNLIDKLKQDFASVNLWYVLIVLLLYLLSNYLRAKKWEMLLGAMGVYTKISNTLGATLIGYLVNLAFPRAGEIARATALAKNEDIAFDKAFGTIVTDRLTDVICLILIVVLAMIFGYQTFFDYFDQNFDASKRLASLYQNIYFLMVIGIVCGLILLAFNKYKTQLTNSVIAKKASGFIIGLKEGLLSITKLKQPYLFSFYSMGTWLCYFLMAYFMFKSYPPTAHLGIATGLVVFVFGTLGIIFPSPAGMGSYHFLIMEGLALYHIDKSDGFVYANLMFFSVQILANLLFGSAAILWMQRTVNKQ